MSGAVSRDPRDGAPRAQAPADAVVVGEALVDLFPEAPGQPLWAVERFERHLGGCGANLAVGLARQGVQTALCGLIGADAFGRFVRERLIGEGVVIDGLSAHRSARTGVVFVGIAEDGERSFLSYRQPSADMLLSEGEVQAAQVGRGRLLCLSSATLVREAARAGTERAVQAARRGAALVFCDVNLRPQLWADAREAGPLVRRLLAQCDAVKLTRAELPLLFGTESVADGAARARRLGPALVVVTLGAEGCYLDCAAGAVFLAGERVAALDKTGAGDAFCAGLWSTLLGELPVPSEGSSEPLQARLLALPLAVLKRACARGNYLGARVCTQLGATTALPRRR